MQRAVDLRPDSVLAADSGILIAELGDGIFLVEQAGQRVHCRRAASCLLLPEPGDRVLLTSAGNADLYLLAVLERTSDNIARLHCEGDLQISSSGALRLAASKEIALDTRVVAVRADEGEVTLEQLRFSGVLWQGVVGSLRWVGQTYESVVDRMTQMSRVCLRRVEQIDQVRAAQLDYEGNARVRIHSKYTAITATHVIKAKARQVHIG